MFIALHVDGLIMVESSSQLYEVVDEMKQYFTMKVISLLSASSTRTCVGARYLRHNDAIWELPTTQYLEVMNEHSMTSASPVVTLVVNRNDDDDDEEEASAEEHRIL